MHEIKTTDFSYLEIGREYIVYLEVFCGASRFPNTSTRAQYANHIEKIMTSDSSLVRNLSNGRVAFWDS
jgi:hypothetical protein